MADVLSDRAWRGRRLSAFLTQFGSVTVETSSRRLRVRRIDGRAVDALHEARRSGLCAATALPLLFGLLVVDACGRPVQGDAFAQLTTRDRGLLLARIIERNATIFGLSTVRGVVDPARLPDMAEAGIADAAKTFLDRYLDVDDVVSAQIIAATRSSNA